ncbi:MAG: fibronectin type protein [Verrucomicrobiales bacterium]|nr:fibronectin type protein [Verrucomicrobiales bacterium]
MIRFSSPFIRFLPGGLLLGLLFGHDVSPAAADAQRPEGANRPRVPTPVARPVQVEVIRGETSSIVLNGLTSTPKSLEFIIRRQPKLGRLEGGMTLQGKDKAVVRYRADPNLKGAVDTFTYSVKVEGSSTSDEGVVTVKITDPAPVLDVTSGVDMGTMLAGTAVEHSLSVRNSGNAAFRATVPLPQGWAWVSPGGGNFEVAPGQTFNATVSVKPSREGPIDEKVVLRGTAVTRFVGTAVAPMQAFPSLLPLAWDPVRKERSGTFEVANNGNAPFTVKLSAPADITLPADITVDSRGKKTVTLLVAGKPDQAVSGTVKLEVPGWSQEVKYQSAAAPAVVTLAGADAAGLVDFGKLDVAGLRTAVKKLTLNNTGGTPAVLRLDPPKSFNISGPADGSVLAPGQEVVVSISPKLDVAGSLKESWKLGATGGDYELELRAELDPESMKKLMMSGVALPPIGPQGSAPVFQVQNEQERKAMALLLYGGIVLLNENTDRSLPTISAVREVKTEPDRLIFEWDAPGEGSWTYRVLSMRLSRLPDFPFPVKDWDVMDNVKVTNDGNKGRAEVTKLMPGGRWTCRIVGIRSDGKETQPGEILTFFTPLPQPRSWTWMLLGAASVLTIGYWVRRKWREDVKWKA